MSVPCTVAKRDGMFVSEDDVDMRLPVADSSFKPPQQHLFSTFAESSEQACEDPQLSAGRKGEMPQPQTCVKGAVC